MAPDKNSAHITTGKKERRKERKTDLVFEQYLFRGAISVGKLNIRVCLPFNFQWLGLFN